MEKLKKKRKKEDLKLISIGISKFDEKFKNILRDYYVYGFKNYNKMGTDRNDYLRIQNILGDNWILERNKNTYVSLKEPKEIESNEFSTFYFFHNIPKTHSLKFDLNYIFDLNKNIKLNNGFTSLQIVPELDHLIEEVDDKGNDIDNMKKILQKAIYLNWKEEIKNNAKNDRVIIRNTKQLELLTVKTNNKKNDNKRNANNHLSNMYKLGLVNNLSYDNPEELKKWINQQYIDRHYKDLPFPNLLKLVIMQDNCLTNQREEIKELKKSSLNYWKINSINAKYLFDDIDLLSIYNMLDFYSQTIMFGEIGELLKQRIIKRLGKELYSAFRFKNNYLLSTLNDYNLYDLYYAMENEYICYIKYTHGINKNVCVYDNGEYIIKPLEVRISTSNGREHIMCYDIINERILSLRLDFIDEIIVYKDVLSKRNDKKNSNFIIQIKNNIDSYRINQNYKNLSMGLIIKRKDIKDKKAKEKLKYVWGVNTNQMLISDKNVSIGDRIVKFDEKNKNFNLLLQKRIYGFSKKKNIIKQKQLKNNEMIPWVRTLYGYVEDTDILDLNFDVEAIYGLYCNGKNLEERKNKGKSNLNKNDKIDNQELLIDTDCNNKFIIDKTELHGSIFNEYFSVFTTIMVDSLLEVNKQYKIQKKSLTESKVKSIIINEIKNNKLLKDINYEGLDDIIFNELRYSELLLRDSNGKHFTRYDTSNCESYLWDILPLSKNEIRWLNTILNHPYTILFIDDNIRMKLLDKIKKSSVKKFNLHFVNYYDQVKSSSIEQNSTVIKTLINIIIKEHKKIKISYMDGVKKEITCCPVWIEYSKKYNNMQIRFRKVENKSLIDINKIKKITILEDDYNLEEERNAVLTEIKDNKKIILIQFFDEVGVPDRILNEFSPWNKTCTYDSSSTLYNLKLYYDDDEEMEIVEKLLGYGPYIKVVNDTGEVLEKIRELIVRQRNILRYRQKEINDKINIER